MKNQWQTIRSIIEANGCEKDRFLSLIDEEGTIFSANANMIRSLQLQNPKNKKISFFDLLHPVNLDNFKNVIRICSNSNEPYTSELYLKNGNYHPMKWQFNCLGNTKEKQKIFLCIGQKLLEDDRLHEFNKLVKTNYQLIAEGLNAAILFQNKEGELMAVNQKVAEIFATTLESLYQLKNIRNLWNDNWTITNEQGQVVSFEEAPFMKALQTGKLEQDILIVKLQNGKDRWIKFSSQPLLEDGSIVPYSVVSNITDITNEKKLVNELEEKKALFSAIMNKTPNLAWVVDEEGNLIFASRAFYQYFGLNEQRSKNKKIVELLPEAVANALYEKHVQVLETGIPAETVEEVRWADGTNFIFQISIFPISGVAGKKMAGSYILDLTDKYTVEKQLRKTNDRLLLLTRTTTDAIWEWDMQTGNIFRNDALMDIIGYQLEEAKGLSWWLRRIHPEDRNRISDKVKDTVERNLHSWEEDYRFKCADGTYKHMRDRGFVIYENGLPVKMIGSFQDITELKELENQLTEEKVQRQKRNI